MKVPFEQPSLLYCDNDSVRYITANSMLHERTKHIEIDCHIVREKLKKGLIHYFFEVGSHQYLFPNLQGVSDYIDTRLIEGN